MNRWRGCIAALLGAAFIAAAATLALVREARSADGAAIAARVLDALEWIVASDLGYDTVPALPQIVLKSAAEINALYYGDTYAGQTNVLALYHRGVVVLPDTLDVERDAYVLVHEMVHHLQWVTERQYPCHNRFEFEAYAIQGVYVLETGEGEMPDRFQLFLLSQCGV